MSYYHLTWEQRQDAEFLRTLTERKKYRVGSYTPPTNSQRFQVDDAGYVIVYTDGACPSNGYHGATAGIGVWFGPNHHLNVSEPLSRQDHPTNQVAEIRAAVRAIQVAKSYGVGSLEIRTDSKYLCDSMNEWIFKWLLNGWQNSQGETLGHRQLFRELLSSMENMDVTFRHIRGHNQDSYVPHQIGNSGADILARAGATKY